MKMGHSVLKDQAVATVHFFLHLKLNQKIKATGQVSWTDEDSKLTLL